MIRAGFAMLAALLPALGVHGACPADTDGDLVVTIDDIVNVVLDFGTDGTAHGGDVNASGLVDIDDVVAVVLAFGPCPPINDDCADAIPVIEGDRSYVTANATTDGPHHPACDGDGDGMTATEDIWFRYTCSFTGFGLFTNCGTADHDSEIAIYRDVACGELLDPLNLLACDDDGLFGCGTGQSSVQTQVCEGQSYLVRVGSGAPGATGAGVLSIAVGVPGGAYIGCDAGPALGPGETVAVETCYSCGDLPFTPNCGDPAGGGNVAWFETVGDGTTYTAAVCATGFTPGMRVYRGNCATMHCVADAPADACGAGVTWCTHPGIEYHIVMYGAGPVTCGAVEVSLASDGTPCP